MSSYQKHKKKILESAKHKYWANREEILERNRRWYHRNKAQIQQYREDNKDRRAAVAKVWRAKNKAYRRQYQTEYRKTEHFQENKKVYRERHNAKHHDRIIESDRKRNKTPERLAWQRRRLKLWRDKLFDILGRKCVGCGFDSNIELLQFDHINGGGIKDTIRILGSSKRSYQYYEYYVTRPIEAKEKLQTFCIKCNWVKKFLVNYMTEMWIISLPKWQKYRIDIKDRLFELIGGWKCVVCGDEDKRALQVDHVGGGGCKDRKKLGNSTDRFYRYYLKHPEEAKKKLRVLCVVCNNS